MIEAFEQMLVHFENYITGNILFGMFCLATLFLIYKSKQAVNNRALIVYMLLFFILIFIPPVAYGLAHFIDDLSLVRIFWLLPVPIVIAYAILSMQKELKKDLSRLLVIVVALIMIWVNASFITAYVNQNSEVQGIPYKIPNAVLNVVDEVLRDAKSQEIENPYVLFPIQMIPFIRQYDARIIQPFGGPRDRIGETVNRNRYRLIENNENIFALFEMSFDSTLTPELLADILIEEGLDYIVIQDSNYIWFEQVRDFYLVKAFYNVLIYRVP